MEKELRRDHFNADSRRGFQSTLSDIHCVQTRVPLRFRNFSRSAWNYVQTTMKRNEVNWAPVVVILSGACFVFVSSVITCDGIEY